MQQSIINKWLETSYSGSINQEVIVCIIQQNEPFFDLSDLQKISQNSLNNFNLTMLDQTLNYRHFKNHIIMTNGVEYQSLEAIKKVLTKNVILVDDKQSIIKMIELLKTKTSDTENQIQHTLLSRVHLEEILKLDTQDLTEFIKLRSHLIQKLNSYLREIDINFLNIYLDIYQHRKVLVASFAQSLYRLASLNFMANDKVIGGQLRKVLGVCSKTIGYKSLKMNLPLELKKNVRAYNLNKDSTETNIKISIAKKLLLLNSKDLDVQKIAKIVDLPQKQIEKVYAKNILK